MIIIKIIIYKIKFIRIFFNDNDALDICEYILFKNKLIKKKYIKNDKTTPFCIIIETPIDKKSLIKILNKTLKGQYIMR